MAAATVAIGITAAVAGLIALALWQRQVTLRREAYIRHFELPPGLFEKLRRHRPGLTLKDCQLVAHALRQFFLAHLKSGRQFVSMPSQVTDDLWHEFILYTRHYQLFCGKAFGRFLHHTPAVVLGTHRKNNEGLRRCFWWTCREENINPRQPLRLPLLFAIDAKLNIDDGFRYAADCSELRARGDGTVHCGADFGSGGGGGDGSTEGFGDGDGGGGGDGGGCGGGGE